MHETESIYIALDTLDNPATGIGKTGSDVYGLRKFIARDAILGPEFQDAFRGLAKDGRVISNCGFLSPLNLGKGRASTHSICTYISNISVTACIWRVTLCLTELTAFSSHLFHEL